MKQVLSVADFATIMNLVDEKLKQVEWNLQEARSANCSEFVIEQIKIENGYDNFKHLKESLQNLNIEVECPDVEIKEDN